MKLYETCFDYKLDAEDCHCEGDWDTEFKNFEKCYNPREDFMEQLSKHDLFLLLCMRDLNNDDYMEEIFMIKSEVENNRNIIECSICGKQDYSNICYDCENKHCC
jgi:hypothetical protein